MTVLLPNGVRELEGHPSVETVNTIGEVTNITVCAECGSLSSVLWLDHDRWYCRVCRNSGVKRPTVVPMNRPGRR